MLAYNGVGWGGMPPTTKVLDDLGLDPGRAFQFPPDSNYDNRVQKGGDIVSETSTMKTQRSISAPNVSHTIINPAESILSEYGNKFGKVPKDHVRSKK